MHKLKEKVCQIGKKCLKISSWNISLLTIRHEFGFSKKIWKKAERSEAFKSLAERSEWPNSWGSGGAVSPPVGSRKIFEFRSFWDAWKMYFRGLGKSQNKKIIFWKNKKNLKNLKNLRISHPCLMTNKHFYTWLLIRNRYKQDLVEKMDFRKIPPPYN